MESLSAIICAAGSSSRMGGKKKEFMFLDEEHTVLGKAIKVFASCKIFPIIICLPPNTENSEALIPADIKDKILICNGGKNRRASVLNSLLFLDSFCKKEGIKISHVLIHDGARPWIKKELVENVINALVNNDAIIPALPLLETPKIIGRKKIESSSQEQIYIKSHLKRADIWLAQTPQAFAFPQILEAHKRAEKMEAEENKEYTDDAEVWGEFMGSVTIIPGDPDNRKITFPEDLVQEKVRK